MIRVGVVGGAGYTGVELLRLLAQHPAAEIAVVTSRSDCGRRVDEVIPSLRGYLDTNFEAPSIEILCDCDVVFFATPNGTAMRMAADLLARGCKVIDLAADFRLRDANVWSHWYGEPHLCPELLREAVYGLPETHREALRTARLVGCAGCYPTATQLGLLPLIESGMIDTTALIADVKSGISGAGRRAETHLLMSEAGEGFKAYSVAGHRHHPEICQELERAGRCPVGLTFVPHLLPMIRGIHATLYARLTADCALQELYIDRYRGEPFVDVLPPGSCPDTRNVRGANRCQIAVHRPGMGNTVVVLAVIDNLVKGAAGQAVQCFNLMSGLDEVLGLRGIALVP